MGRKIKTSIALDENLLSWIEEMVKRKRFANRTHAIEYALQRLKEQETEELHIKSIDVISADAR
jgi:Arc/MetJ-type ribon-helix-helix transcriptional regulator